MLRVTPMGTSINGRHWCDMRMLRTSVALSGSLRFQVYFGVHIQTKRELTGRAGAHIAYIQIPHITHLAHKFISSISRSGFCKERVDAKCYSAKEHQLGDGAHRLDEDSLACAFCAGRVDRRDVCGGDLYRGRHVEADHESQAEGIIAYLGRPRQDSPAT